MDQPANLLTALNGDRLPDHAADLPGIATWGDRNQWAKERLASAATLMHRVLVGVGVGVGDGRSIPSTVVALADVYDRVSARAERG